jgi:hypothetical protein
MKTPRAPLAAAAIPLLLTSLSATAGELPFNAPNTARAQESAQLPSATPHWTSLIGTGHAASTDATTSSHGVPATPHWTARIGSGTAASSSTATENQQLSPSNNQSVVAHADWTSRIGTGHAAESNGRQGT